ncbi:hypothetical protein LCGC14_2829370 [marine sediment metagenome]|uniref:Uncharacterized protein n=1 Tax=marine sediment metagenome TaxID=412755 RepID=A0A0F8Z1A3_9ZZZZ
MLGRQEPRLTFRTLTMVRMLPPGARETEIALPRDPVEPFTAPKYDRVQHRLAHPLHFLFWNQTRGFSRFVDFCRQLIVEFYALEGELCLTILAALPKPKGETAESETE